MNPRPKKRRTRSRYYPTSEQRAAARYPRHMNTADDQRHMARALHLAVRGLYTTDPNPRVGCVLVKDGRVVGEGWHEYAGGPHAEINALAQAGSEAAGATAYVSLEPCCHQGRTPPCTAAQTVSLSS